MKGIYIILLQAALLLFMVIQNASLVNENQFYMDNICLDEEIFKKSNPTDPLLIKIKKMYEEEPLCKRD